MYPKLHFHFIRNKGTFDPMKHIEIKHIETALDWVDEATDEQLEEGITAFSEKQPVLLDYVLAAPSEYENEALEGYLLYYFWVIIESFNQAGLTPVEITEEMIEAFQPEFSTMLDAYFEQDDEESEQMLEDFCDQPELTRFMAMEVSTDDEDGTSMDDETATQLFIVTAAMITLLNRASQA